MHNTKINFGKLNNNNEIEFVTFPIKNGNNYIYTIDSQLLLSLGYKNIIYSPKPQKREDGQYIYTWKEEEKQIIQTWEFIPYTSEELQHTYEIEIVNNIRQSYDVNQEIAILRKYLTYGDLYKNEFEDYNEYVEQCKEKAHQKIYKKPYKRPKKE